jgi:hypothetical protein
MRMRYLLKTLSEAERTRFEESVFAEDSEFEELEIAEDELIDRYVRDDLGAADRNSFEEVLLKNRRIQERVAFAKTFLAKVDAAGTHELPQDATVAPRAATRFERAAPKSAFFGSIFRRPRIAWTLAAICALALLATPVWIFWLNRLYARTRQSETQIASIEQQKRDLERQVSVQQARSAQLSAELQAATEQKLEQEKAIEMLEKGMDARTHNVPSIALLTLFTGSFRGGNSGNELTIGPQTQQVRLIIGVGAGEYQSYRAKIATPDAKAVYQNDSLTVHGKNRRNLRLQFPANRLTEGDYLVRVEGVKSSGESAVVAEYSFRVRNRR